MIDLKKRLNGTILEDDFCAEEIRSLYEDDFNELFCVGK
jgi:hypothetical protein